MSDSGLRKQQIVCSDDKDGGSLSPLNKIPGWKNLPEPTQQKLTPVVLIGGALAALVLLFKIPFIGPLLGGLIFTATTTFTFLGVVLPLLPILLPLAGVLFVGKIVYEILFGDDDVGKK